MAAPNVTEGQRRVFQNNIASTIQNLLATGHTTPDQIAHAAQRNQESTILADAAEAARRGDVTQVNLNAAGVLGKKELTPFKTDAHGITTNEYVGSRDETGAGARAARAVQEAMAKHQTASAANAYASAGLHRAQTEDLTGRGGLGKAPPGYAWGPKNDQGQPTLLAIEGGPANRTGTNAADAGLSGEDFLKTLPPGVASNIKGVVSGNIPITAFSTRGGERERILSLAGQYEPGFDLTQWKRRNETAAAFSKGQQGNAVRAVNQTIAHAGSLADAIENLNNMGGMGTILNPIVNAAQERSGDPRQGVFRQKAMAVSSELRKVFAASGATGGLTELEKWESTLPLNASKDQQRAYLRSGLELLGGAIGALDDQYKRGMGPNASVMDILSPQAKETLAKLKGGATASADRRRARTTYTQADLEYTAQKRGMTVDQVKAQLGID